MLLHSHFCLLVAVLLDYELVTAEDASWRAGSLSLEDVIFTMLVHLM